MNFGNKIIRFLEVVANKQLRTKIIPVDFKAPWWKVITDQKLYLSIMLISFFLVDVFKTLFPMLIAIVFENPKVEYLGMLILGWIVVVAIEHIKKISHAALLAQSVQSVHYHAHKMFLLVDPIYHTYRATGSILGKINRASVSYEDFIEAWDDIIPTIISAVTATVSMAFFDSSLSLYAGATLLFLGVFSSIIMTYATFEFETVVNRADDNQKAVSVENLTQVNLIRSVFASSLMVSKLKDTHKTVLKADMSLRLVYILLRTFFYMSYVAVLAIMGVYVIRLVNAGTMTAVLATSLILTYIRGTEDVLRISSPIRYFMRAYTRITDFFDFAKKFGRQTYPVLSVGTVKEAIVHEIKSNKEIVLDASSISFDYFSGARIFDDHNFKLTINIDQKNKLCGIIGPSGAGKTTFFSIFGGQLRPALGTVKLNGIDIYSIDDDSRRDLIALQGQIATTLRGTLKYNLLFGIPKDIACYPDDLLINILEAVGLWAIFKNKDGLNTMIGEGGFGLSGGQKQRLNFANLYLRAQFYRPILILIDEPTSSLDEISEKAITEMISELAKTAVTLVIAHRIKTLEDAIGILDFSLLSSEKDMKFYSKQELQSHSPYYQKLLRGEYSIEE